MMKRIVALSVFGIVAACSTSEEESDLLDEIGPVPDGVRVYCNDIKWEDEWRIDPFLCGFDDGGAPGLRLYKIKRGSDCTEVESKDGYPIRRTYLGYGYKHNYQEIATVDCSNT